MGGIVQYDIRIDPLTGLLCQARQVLSAHCDPRPPGVAPELIVVHGISLPPGEFGGPWIERMFTGTLEASAHPYFQSVAELRVSAHLLVRRDGEPVQFVPFGLRAWHAGASSWQGRSDCNDFSIGIELEGTDEGAYDDRQYETLPRLITALCAAYPTLSSARVVGHSEIAPGRKSDPGPAFDWARLRKLLG
jgi:AmpD protein